ncbi:MAG: biopolymer transporter ExbD [Kiritimatiellae bacterium]|nr:biopolymer transporter ExbD [Kiritimatiellia bacterium]
MARKQYDNPQLDMTPMIDVVFELIIFFVVTIKQEDLFSKLNANRPAPNPNRPNEKVVDEQIVIEVGANGLIYNGRPVSVKELDRNIKMAASVSKKTTVLLQCSLDSPHKFLVDALDVCNKHGLQNLSIFSM